MIPDIVGRHVEADSFVTAGDIEADRRRADLIVVGQHPADGHRIAQVVVGHQCHVLGIAGTSGHLFDGVFEGHAPHGYVIDLLHAQILRLMRHP